MFWKNKTEPTLEPAPQLTQEVQKTDAEVLRDAASSLADTLRAYSEAAYKAAKPKPDHELQAAYDTVAAAEKLVKEGRLAYALGRCLPEHVKYWPSWIERDDFKKHVGFNAESIAATKREDEGAHRNVAVAIVDFVFNDTQYRLTLRDEGMSSAPGDPYRFGEVELLADGKRVAKFGLIEDISNQYSTWEFSDVRALSVGTWMQDVLDMAAQVEASSRKWIDDFNDERAKAAAREIDLG